MTDEGYGKELKKLLLFAGTTEGRRLAEVLAENGVPCVVCVATEYGAQVMEVQGAHPLIKLRQGRMDEAQMQELMQAEVFWAVVDATHPFAVEVSENIRNSSRKAGLEYLRLKRETGSSEMRGSETGFSEMRSFKTGFSEFDAERPMLRYFEDNETCAAFLAQTQGAVLLTTGSKELEVYCRENLRERLYVRVLPGTESVGLCERAGICGGRILALQGPFSEEFNLALMKQYGICWLVTKESGRTGGYFEKLSAAQKAGIPVCVIGNPEKAEGLSFAQTLQKISGLIGVEFTELKRHKRLEISLIGIGMGSMDGLTIGAYRACQRAEYIFGAKRLLGIAAELGAGNKEAGQAKQYAYYLAEDILPCLERAMEEHTSECQEEPLRAAVLFSGDSGFYSGCGLLYGKLQDWRRNVEADDGWQIFVKVYPGISSVSYLAAAVGQSWQDAGIFSTHGRGGAKDWQEPLLAMVQKYEKTFVLTSGVEDVRKIGALLHYGMAQGTGGSQKDEIEVKDMETGRIADACKSVIIITGRALSYPDEEIVERTPKECMELTGEGMYTCLILYRLKCGRDNLGTGTDVGMEMPHKKQITHGLPDTCFIRGGTPVVPMTKEEMREVVISKLRLTSNAVVYDVGSGTGSVAVEIGRICPNVAVYALERKVEGIGLIRRNMEQFGLSNIHVLQTQAPDGFSRLPAPTHAFIGGSDGRLREILRALREKNPAVRVVMTAVSLETLAEVTQILKDEAITQAEVVSLQVSRARGLGKYHLMQAENPVWVVSFEFAAEDTGNEKLEKEKLRNGRPENEGK